jgi:hypothetical protein
MLRTSRYSVNILTVKGKTQRLNDVCIMCRWREYWERGNSLMTLPPHFEYPSQKKQGKQSIKELEEGKEKVRGNQGIKKKT